MSTQISSKTQSHKLGYLPSLDGWRALAVIGVMLTHDRWGPNGEVVAEWKGYGGYGVQLFFAISGFLITSRILEEERIVGSFHIGRFYLRRLFRIQPAALAYLLAAALLMLSGTIVDRWDYWWGGLLSYQNYLFHPPEGSAILGHYWSLSVEEHFYVLLSLIFLFVKKGRAIVVGTLWLLSLALLMLPWFRHHGMRPDYTPHATQWQIHYLLYAAFIAIVVRWTQVRQFAQQWLRPVTVFSATILLVLARNLAREWHLHLALNPVKDLGTQADYLATWFFALWVLSTVFHPASWCTRFLELPPLRFIGRISYSLYLWHIPIFYSGGPSRIHAAWLRFLWGKPQRYIAAFAVATASYYLIEKPLIRLGHRLAPAATPGRRTG